VGTVVRLYEWGQGLGLGAAMSVSWHIVFRGGWSGLPSRQCWVYYAVLVGVLVHRLGLSLSRWDEVGSELMTRRLGADK
jgi:hypothetical protein